MNIVLNARFFVIVNFQQQFSSAEAISRALDSCGRGKAANSSRNLFKAKISAAQSALLVAFVQLFFVF